MRVIKNKETNTTLTRHTDIDGGMWFTINSNDEFQYMGVVVDGVAVFDDWGLDDVILDCPSAISILDDADLLAKEV